MKKTLAIISSMLMAGSAFAAASMPMASAASNTPDVNNVESSYYRINTYADNNCKSDRRIISPGYGTGYISARSSYRVDAKSEIWVTGGAHKKVARNVCYNFGSQERYFVKSFKN